MIILSDAIIIAKVHLWLGIRFEKRYNNSDREPKKWIKIWSSSIHQFFNFFYVFLDQGAVSTAKQLETCCRTMKTISQTYRAAGTRRGQNLCSEKRSVRIVFIVRRGQFNWRKKLKKDLRNIFHFRKILLRVRFHRKKLKK